MGIVDWFFDFISDDTPYDNGYADGLDDAREVQADLEYQQGYNDAVDDVLF